VPNETKFLLNDLIHYRKCSGPHCAHYKIVWSLVSRFLVMIYRIWRSQLNMTFLIKLSHNN